MNVYPFNIRSSGCLKGIFLLLLMTLALDGMAQNPDKLPDSVNVSEEVSPPNADPSTQTPAGPQTGTGAQGSTDSAGISSDSQSAPAAVPDSIVLRSVADTTLSEYRKDKNFEYANDPAYWKADSLLMKAPPKYQSDNGNEWGVSLRTLVFIVIVGLLLALVYRQFFYRAPLRIDGVELQEGAGGTEEEFDARIREAMQAKDYRSGTRYLFLKALQMLDRQQLIHYQQKATNHEYVLQMSAHREGARFRFLADAYDHVWYGEFLLSEDQFGRLRGYFEDFFTSLSVK